MIREKPTSTSTMSSTSTPSRRVSARRRPARSLTASPPPAAASAVRSRSPVARDMTASCVASSRSRMPICRPSRMTRMRSLIASTSGRSEEMKRMAIPCSASSRTMACTSALAPTSIPRVGSSRTRILGPCVQPLAEHHLLLVAAGQLGDHVRGGRRLDLQPLPEPLGRLLFGGTADEAEPRQVAAQHGQRDVGRDRQRHGQAELAAVLGHVGDAGLLGGPRRGDAPFPPFDLDGAVVGRLHAEQGQSHVRPARPPPARRSPAPRPRAGRSRSRRTRPPGPGPARGTPRSPAVRSWPTP